MIEKSKFLLCFFFALISFSACVEEETVIYSPSEEIESKDPIDLYFKDSFLTPYNCAVRWKWVDRYVSIDFYVTPIDREFVQPVGEMIKRFWIEPFLELSKSGETFIKTHFPPEIVFIGSPLFNKDGTVTQGYADAGVRITLTELNYYNLSDKDWLRNQLSTMHHEFTHIVHQKHGLPSGFELITGGAYTGNSWVNLDEQQAIKRGMVTPYGTSSEFEDFAEIVAEYLLTSEDVFNHTFFEQRDPDDGLNEGRGLIRKKMDLIDDYYQSNFQVDLARLKEIIQSRLNEL